MDITELNRPTGLQGQGSMLAARNVAQAACGGTKEMACGEAERTRACIISSVPRTAPLSTAAISVGNHYCSCKPPHHHHHLFSAAHRPRRPVDDEAEVADEARDQAAYGRADARRSSGTGAAAADAERGTGVRRTVRAFDEAGPDPPGSRAAVCAAARDIRPCAQLQEIE